MRYGNKFSVVNHPSRWPKYIMAHRRPRDWLMTISGVVLLFIVAGAVAMGYLVTSHPGKPEPNPGIAEEQAAEKRRLSGGAKRAAHQLRPARCPLNCASCRRL